MTQAEIDIRSEEGLATGPPPRRAATIDVMIITYNESLNLPHCLRALQGWADRVFVIDSGSTDDTPKIAEAYGTEIVHHDWAGYARQKNWGLQNLPLESDWVLVVDADEVVTDDVRRRLDEITSRPVDEVPENGFFINRLTYFLGRPIRHCGYYPSWNMRFFKRGSGYYEEREVHEHVIIDDPVGYIHDAVIHYDRRGLEHYFAKHNRYSTLEASALWTEMSRHGAAPAQANLSPATRRRRWLKRYVLPYVPVPWAWRFIYMYILRLGILDGRAGLEFCKFIGMYDYLVAMKLRALRRLGRQAPHAPVGAEGDADRLSAGAEPPPPPPVSPPAFEAVGADAPPAPETGADDGTAAGSRTAVAPVEAPQPVPAGVDDEPAATATAVAPAPADAADDADADAPPPTTAGSGFGDLRCAARATGAKKSVSILILTLNEESNLPDCLRSVEFSDDIVVFDSISTDDTVKVAKANGARVVERPFDNWSAHQNWAMKNIEFKHDWVFYLDADERMTPGLRDELLDIVNLPDDPNVAYYCGRKNYFMGKWIKRSMPPGILMRFFRPSHVQFERLVNPTAVVHGEHGYLEHLFDHYNFSKGITEWLDKHNKYSVMEAMEGIKLLRGEAGAQPSLLSRDAALRRKALKNLSFRLPLRPVVKFAYMYFGRLGLLDGLAGLTYCTLQAVYEYMIVLKMKELQRRSKGLPI